MCYLCELFYNSDFETPKSKARSPKKTNASRQLNPSLETRISQSQKLSKSSAAIPIAASAPSGQINFADVSNAAGIFFIGGTYGATWGDYNGDGLPDIWVNNHFRGPDILYKNQGNGTFADVTTQVFASGDLGGDDHGPAWADFDNDGDQDLLQPAGAEGSADASPRKVRFWYNNLYVNNGGLLSDQALARGIGDPLRREQSVLWFDFNNDGLLDIFLGALPRDNNELPPTILRQTPTGSFVDARAEMGFNLPFAPLGFLSDLTGDGKLDLIVKSTAPAPGLVVYSTASLPLVDVTSTLVPKLDFQDLAIADFNGDLRPDIFVTQKRNFLLENTEKGFVRRADEVGLSKSISANGQSVVAADFDNDMDVDVFVVTGKSTYAPDILYENLGNGTFAQVPNAGGAAGPELGKGDSVATADYDLDGFVDLFVTNGKDEKDGPHRLFRNQGNGNNWLQIDLQGVTSNRDGIGARVFATTGGVTQLREQTGGFHKWSQNDKRLHFGLAQNTKVDLLEIRWPSGTIQQLQNISANQILRVVEAPSILVTPSPADSPGKKPSSDNKTANTIRGTRKNDRLMGTALADDISGLGKNDTLAGKGADDVLRGDVGSDALWGGEGDDSLNGGIGNDTLIGGVGNDIYVLRKGIGSDIIRGFQKGDRIELLGNLEFKNLKIERVKNGTLLQVGNDPLAVALGVKPSMFNANAIV